MILCSCPPQEQAYAGFPAVHAALARALRPAEVNYPTPPPHHHPPTAGAGWRGRGSCGLQMFSPPCCPTLLRPASSGPPQVQDGKSYRCHRADIRDATVACKVKSPPSHSRHESTGPTTRRITGIGIDLRCCQRACAVGPTPGKPQGRRRGADWHRWRAARLSAIVRWPPRSVGRAGRREKVMRLLKREGQNTIATGRDGESAQ